MLYPGHDYKGKSLITVDLTMLNKINNLRSQWRSQPLLKGRASWGLGFGEKGQFLFDKN